MKSIPVKWDTFLYKGQKLKTKSIKIKSSCNPSELAVELIDMGYEKTDEIALPGQFVVAGGTISIRTTGEVNPIKIDFFGTNIDRIYSYKQEDGRKIEELKEFQVTANNIILADGAIIRPGEYLVHEDYGVGLFHNLGLRRVEGEDRPYIFVEYRNGDFLYVPDDMRHKLSPYIGVGSRKPKLNRLGSQSWSKTYKKTYENALLMARELLTIYAKRSVVNRRPWKVDQKWNEEIIKSFQFIDTVDQAQAIRDVFEDIQKNIPMDRLVSGDVGFGKTEVAIRAAAQAIANGYQVVMLVPTTILVEQHFETFKKRFQNLPVSIEHLSRFVEGKEQKRIIENVKLGTTDILIGTHRLLGEDIRFKNLGLFVIDEEQRFGVKQKEKLKLYKEEVNVLTLSATPIPRTLFMSLSGLRDISQIYSPPGGRKEIKTEIAQFNDKLVATYINRESERGGQVYYLYNEVAAIEGKKRQLMRQFPDLSISVAHGQMSEERLAEAMGQFANGKTDILVCSTIIENGLDLPNANTLIVERSDHFGLSQLYQIRGRIGRSKKQAYAIFTYANKNITQLAYKRLKALAENTELGSGYTIALSDLEIRGGGNVLGKEQHGSMEAVGLILYSKLLKLAVEKLSLGRPNLLR